MGFMSIRAIRLLATNVRSGQAEEHAGEFSQLVALVAMAVFIRALHARRPR